MLFPALFQIRVMIPSFRYIVTSLTTTPLPPNPLIYTLHCLTLAWAKNLPNSHFLRSTLMHTCPGKKKSCLSLYCWIPKTSAKRPQVTSYILVTFCDCHALRGSWIICASSTLPANLNSIFTQCHSRDEFQHINWKRDITIFLLLKVQYEFNNKQQTQRNRRLCSILNSQWRGYFSIS